MIVHHLNEEGLFVQWLQLYESNMHLMSSVMKAISENFGDYAIYFTNSSDVMIVAKKQGKISNPTGMIFDFSDMATALKRLEILNEQDLLIRKVGSKRILNPLFQSFNISTNSDYFLVLAQKAPKSMFLKQMVPELEDLNSFAIPIAEILADKPPLKVSSVSKNLFLYSANIARQGHFIFQHLQSVESSKISPKLKFDAKTLSLLQNIQASFCDMLSAEQTWLPHLHKLAKFTVPFLSPPEMAVIWQHIESKPCFEQLSEKVKNWVNIYKAVGARNFEKMQHFAVSLLPKTGEIAASKENHYLLTVAMLAYDQLDQPRKAMVLSQRYKNWKNPPIILRFILTWMSSQPLSR